METHDVKRYWAGCRCDVCRRANSEYAANNKAKNPEAVRKRDKVWQDKNRDRVNERRRGRKEGARKNAASLVKRRLRERGALLDFVVDNPVVSSYLVYALVDPRTVAVRYVGVSSTGLGRPKSHGTPANVAKRENKRKCDWIAELQASGLNYAIRVLEYFDTPEEAHAAEPYWIQWMRSQGEHLYNITAGDESCIRVSEETKQKMREAMTGREITWGDKISAAKKGKRFGGRIAKTFTYEGLTLTLFQWAELKGVEEATIRARLKYGWSFEEALAGVGDETPKYKFLERSQTLKQWAVEFGLLESTLRSRILQQKWTIGRALTTPIRVKS